MPSIKPRSVAILAFGAAAMLSSLPAFAASDGSWFVVREETTSNCHTQQLVSVGGGYASGSQLRAGGPYGSRDAALKRLGELQRQGVCTKG